MIQYTKPLNINGKVKVGKQVPDGAIELCRFDNGVNKTKTSNSISSSSEKTLNQAKLGKTWVIVKDQEEINDDVFPKETKYSDEGGYSGYVKFKKSDWVEKVRYLKQYKKETIEETYPNYQSVPKTYEYDNEDYKGSLNLTKLETLDKKTAKKKVYNGETKIVASEMLYSDKNSFPSSLEYNKNGYKGNLKLFGVVAVANQKEGTLTTDKIYSKKENGVFPTFINKNGFTYYPTGEFIDKSETRTEIVQETNKVYETKTIDTWVKHYGVCRYWGGGSSTSNNYYGDPDSRFYVGNKIAKGYMNGMPTPTLHRWNHTLGKACTHKPEKYPIDCTGGYWDSKVGEKNNIKWTYDIEEAAKYGGSTDKAKGGVVWASDYWKNSGGVWPPKGYENDYLGGGHLTQVTPGNNSTIAHTNKLCVKAGPQKTSLAGYYNAGGWYCKWYRDIVLFYKGLTQKQITIEKDVVSDVEHIIKTVWQEGVYEAMAVKPNGYDIYYKAIYIGDVSKESYSEVEELSSILVRATYEGIATKKDLKFDGKAFYEGMVYKKVFVDPTATAENKNNIFIVDTDGFLKYHNKKSEFKSQYVVLTNIAKNGTPLLYTNKMASKFYLPNGPTKTTILNNSYIDITYDKNIIDDITFLVRLTPCEDSLYSVEILTDKCIGSTDNVYGYFANKDGSITREQLASELIYTQGIDYRSEEQSDGINYKIQFGDSSAKTDDRNKVEYRYVLKTLDGAYSSNERIAYVVNKEYALDGELVYFLGDKMCISPELDGEKLTAKEIIAHDNNILLDDLKYSKVVIESILNGDIVNGYTEPNGNSLVYASTYEDTGYPVSVDDKIEYTGKDEEYFMKSSVNGIVHNAFYVTLANQDWLKVLNPYNNNDYKNWYSRVKYFPFELSSTRNNTNITATYSMREYCTDSYHETLGMPYKTIVEKPIILNDHTIKLSRSNILFKTDENKNLDRNYFRVYLKESGKELTVKSFDINSSIAIIKEVVTESKNIECEYVYCETSYEYKGFSNNNVFYHLDLNPNLYHTYINQNTGNVDNSYNLFNHTIYLFLRPTSVINHDTNEVIEDNINSNSLYHKIDNPEQNGPYDLLIGIISPTPFSSMLNTVIEKPTTIGGGIKNKYIGVNKDKLDGFYDINLYSEKSIQKNGTVVLRLDKEVLNKYSKNEIKNTLEKHLSIGVLPIIL